MDNTKFRWPLIWCVATLCSGLLFNAFVDLKPQVEENFFFSSDDPQFQADKSISKLFPQPPQVIISAKGDVTSVAYQKKIADLTGRLLLLPEVVEVQSVSRGPKDAQSALDSPLWSRALISEDRKASFISILVKGVAIEKSIAQIEKVKEEMGRDEHFELAVSGAPYIVEIIRRNLSRDLKVFSLVAFLVFAALVFILFRSLAILAGTLITCLNVSMLTLVVSGMLHIRIGPLTSNLAVIVFVLALSHIIFLTFNWKHALETSLKEDSVSQAIKATFHPSLWSMVTQVLGFMSLLFVKATPLRQLGISGTLGTLIAFAAAYCIYPSFLRMEATRSPEKRSSDKTPAMLPFFEKTHQTIATVLLVLTVIAGIGIARLNTDPSLLSYFKKGSELRDGLEYIDRNGGSTPLKIVIADAKGGSLDTNEAYDNLRKLHEALERDPAVGNVLSMPIIMAEAKLNPLGAILPVNWLLNLLENATFGEVTKYFMTKDRKDTLFLLRMREAGRQEPRLSIVKRVEGIVTNMGFKPVLTGGVYLLQGKLSALVVESILFGLILLVIIFTVIGGWLSGSLLVAWAILVSLCMIPLCTIGIIGHFHVPFDVISSPGANIAIGMGVDSMINMLFFVKRHAKGKEVSAAVWGRACSRLWRPIVYVTVLTCVGFGIFTLSVFPPSQRFGLSVILGMLVSPLAALFVFPWLAARNTS